MDKSKIEKINKFLDDEALANAVYDILAASFLKKRERKDIYMVAAERIAIDLLEEGWKDLLKIKRTRSQGESVKRVGHV